MSQPLSPSEFSALAGAVPRLLLVWALLPVIGMKRLRRGLWRLAQETGEPQEYDPALWQRRAIAIRRIASRLPGCHCLARSITLSNWLNRAGHRNSLKIGITGSAATLKSHSWVEKDNKILDDSPENIARFKKIAEI